MTIDGGAAVLAHVVRGGVVESAHLGHLVLLDARGRRIGGRGDPDVTILARSALKPLQAVAMLRCGLDLDDDLLVLACASHAGEPAHLARVERILAGAGLTADDLQNTPGLPLGEQAALTHRRAGLPPTRLAQNCSGKHAAMLATCVTAGWDHAGYRDPAHPLQRAVAATLVELSGDGGPTHVTVDGCGTALYSCSLAGLARAFARLATAAAATTEGRVTAAMRAHPHLLGGTGRTVTRLAEAVPGLVAKDGAEGVHAGALPDGRAYAVKILDGAARPVPVLVVAALRALGVTAPALDEIGRVPVLGHGEPVGCVRAVG